MTVHPRRRSSPASSSERRELNICCCADCRQVGAAMDVLPSDSVSSSWVMNAAASSRGELSSRLTLGEAHWAACIAKVGMSGSLEEVQKLSYLLCRGRRT